MIHSSFDLDVTWKRSTGRRGSIVTFCRAATEARRYTKKSRSMASDGRRRADLGPRRSETVAEQGVPDVWLLRTNVLGRGHRTHGFGKLAAVEPRQVQGVVGR